MKRLWRLKDLLNKLSGIVFTDRLFVIKINYLISILTVNAKRKQKLLKLGKGESNLCPRDILMCP